MSYDEQLRAAHFREAAEICKRINMPSSSCGAQGVNACWQSLEAAAPLPSTHTVIIPRAWLEEAAHDVEHFGSYASDIQKWKERAKK